MTNDLGAWLINLIATWPELIWVFIGASIVASVLRVTWADEATRPRAVVAILALCDLLQVNPSGIAKLVAKPPVAPAPKVGG